MKPQEDQMRIGLRAGFLSGTMKIKKTDWGNVINIPALLENGAFVFIFKPGRYPEYILSEVKRA